MLKKEFRWNTLESSREREEVFYEFLVKRKIKERQGKMLKLKKYLIMSNWFNTTIVWREVCRKLEEVTEFRTCTKLDRLEVFKDVIKTLEENETKTFLIQNHNRAIKESYKREELNLYLFRQLK